MLRRTLRCATLLASLLAATPGCSGGSAASRGLPGGDAGDDAGAQLPSPGTADAAPDAAPPQTFVPLPQVPFQGGPTIAHVKLVTITFAGYPYQQQMQAFGDWIVGSTWLQTVGAEYGVGTGTHVAKLVVDYTPP